MPLSHQQPLPRGDHLWHLLVVRLVRYDKLKEDFKFNLGLIEDRDAELGRLEATLQELRDCLRDKVCLHRSTESNLARRPSRLGVLVGSECLRVEACFTSCDSGSAESRLVHYNGDGRMARST